MGWFTNRRTKTVFRTEPRTKTQSITEAPEADSCEACGKVAKLASLPDGTGMVCPECLKQDKELSKKESEELASKRLYGRDAIFEGFNPTYPTNTKKEE